jgi:hypothetical protein
MTAQQLRSSSLSWVAGVVLVAVLAVVASSGTRAHCALADALSLTRSPPRAHSGRARPRRAVPPEQVEQDDRRVLHHQRVQHHHVWVRHASPPQPRAQSSLTRAPKCPLGVCARANARYALCDRDAAMCGRYARSRSRMCMCACVSCVYVYVCTCERKIVLGIAHTVSFCGP